MDGYTINQKAIGVRLEVRWPAHSYKLMFVLDDAVPDVGSPNAREERGDIHEDPWLMPNNKTELISILFQYSAIFPKTHPKVVRTASVIQPGRMIYLTMLSSRAS